MGQQNRQLSNRQNNAPANRPPANPEAAAQATEKLSGWLMRPESLEKIGGALAGWMNPQDFVAQLLVALEDPKLAECSVRSKFEAALKCGVMGLIPTFQQVALIPKFIKNVGMCVTVMPQWQGYKALMERNAEVLDVEAFIVHVKDEFAYADGEVLHRYNPLDPDRKITELKDIQGGYCVVKWRDPTRPKKYHFCPASYIAQCRACADTVVVWNKWFEQMVRKTIYRSAYTSRVVPMDPLVQERVERVLKHDDEMLGNDPRRVIESAPAGPALPPVQAAFGQSRSQRLAQQYNNGPSLPPPPPPPEDGHQDDEEAEQEDEQHDDDSPQGEGQGEGEVQQQGADDPHFALKCSLKEADRKGKVERIREVAKKHAPPADHPEIDKLCDARRKEIDAAAQSTAQ